VVDTASASGISRKRITAVISGWELGGYIETTPSQVRAQFRLLKPDEELPSTPADLEELAVKLAKTMVEREEKELLRLKSVINVATGSECAYLLVLIAPIDKKVGFALALATYFGDGESVPNGRCGNCSVSRPGPNLRKNWLTNARLRHSTAKSKHLYATVQATRHHRKMPLIVFCEFVGCEMTVDYSQGWHLASPLPV